MESESEVQSSHNSSETTNVTVYSWDDFTDGQVLCLEWAGDKTGIASRGMPRNMVLRFC